MGAGGEPIWHAEIGYNDPAGKGGPVSRIVADAIFADEEEGGLAGQPLIRIPGYGNHIQRLALQGLWGANALPTGDYPISGLEIDNPSEHATDARTWIGIEVEKFTSQLGTGKLVCPGSLAIMFCRAAIKCSGDNNENDNHADQLFLDRFLAAYCDVGLWVTNRQSVGHRIGYFDQVHCNTGFRFDAGGKLWCGDLVMQDDSAFGLLLTGNDASIGGNAAAFRIDRLTIDGTAPLDCQAVHVEPTSGSCFAMVDIGFLHASSVRSGITPPVPLIELNDYYGDLNIYGGVYLYEGMIKVTGGTEQFFPTIRIHNARFRNGYHPMAVFHPDSTGYAQYEVVSCCEMNGNPMGGALWGGKMFPDFRGFVDAAAAPLTAIDGGFIYRRGAMRSTGASTDAASLTDEVITMTGSGATLNLLDATYVRGIIYHIRNTSGGSITIDPAGSQTIDGSATKTLSSGAFVSIISDGSGWLSL